MQCGLERLHPHLYLWVFYLLIQKAQLFINGLCISTLRRKTIFLDFYAIFSPLFRLRLHHPLLVRSSNRSTPTLTSSSPSVSMPHLLLMLAAQYTPILIG